MGRCPCRGGGSAVSVSIHATTFYASAVISTHATTTVTLRAPITASADAAGATIAAPCTAARQ